MSCSCWLKADQAGAILSATLTKLSKGKPSGSIFALLASLPATVLDDSARQAILQGAQASEAHADQEMSTTLRQALAHLIQGSSVKVIHCRVCLC